MDRFRFRAWDKEKKVMVYLDLGSNNLAASRLHVALFSDYRREDYGILMQSTGLKDKNGKLSYEGDVVRIATPPCQIQNAVLIGKIIYSWAAWAIEITQIEKWEKFRVSPPDTGGIIYFLNIVDREWEVIGNIYEILDLIGG